ncbi:MAG: Hsp20/alpha crystallin family protein [Gammaproteobacteria bacterium]|nr:MAG: Hsp20/alpha crystallin family protein [Gammaproteobacteria bacterium]
MSLVRYEPWNILNQLHGEVDRMFNTRLGRIGEDNEQLLSSSDWTPAVDIKEEDSRYIIRADVPGVDPKDIEINMEDGVLSIKGERHSETTDEREGYKRVERVRGSFFRRFSMPDTADAEAVTAKSKDGVLEIVIPKQEKLQPKRIQVEH